MTEDIVDVLRAFQSAYQEKCSAAEMGRYLATWMSKAADEIERLREELAKRPSQAAATGKLAKRPSQAAATGKLDADAMARERYLSGT